MFTIFQLEAWAGHLCLRFGIQYRKDFEKLAWPSWLLPLPSPEYVLFLNICSSYRRYLSGCAFLVLIRPKTVATSSLFYYLFRFQKSSRQHWQIQAHWTKHCSGCWAWTIYLNLHCAFKANLEYFTDMTLLQVYFSSMQPKRDKAIHCYSNIRCFSGSKCVGLYHLGLFKALKHILFE